MTQYLVSNAYTKQNALNEFLVQEFVNNDHAITISKNGPLIMNIDSVYSTLLEKTHHFYLWNQIIQRPIIGDRIVAIPNSPGTLMSVNTFGYPTNSLNQFLQSHNEASNHESL